MKNFHGNCLVPIWKFVILICFYSFFFPLFFTRSIVRCHAITIPGELNYKQVLFGHDGLNANIFWLYNVLFVVERIIFLYFELCQVWFQMNVFWIRNFQKELWYFILDFPILWSSFCTLNCDRVYFILLYLELEILKKNCDNLYFDLFPILCDRFYFN